MKQAACLASDGQWCVTEMFFSSQKDAEKFLFNYGLIKVVWPARFRLVRVAKDPVQDLVSQAFGSMFGQDKNAEYELELVVPE